MSWDDIKTARIAKVQADIDGNPDFKKIIEEKKDYVEQCKKYSFDELMQDLQPKWSNQRFLDEDGQKE